jgi:coat protein Gp5
VSSTGGTLTTATFNSATLTFVGAASTSYVQNLMYHKEAFQFVTADLPIMDDAAKCVRRVQDGLSLRVWQASDIRNDELLMRIDILYGFAALRPEWACRITS